MLLSRSVATLPKSHHQLVSAAAVAAADDAIPDAARSVQTARLGYTGRSLTGALPPRALSFAPGAGPATRRANARPEG